MLINLSIASVTIWNPVMEV